MTLRPDEIDPLDPETVECPYPYYDALPVHRARPSGPRPQLVPRQHVRHGHRGAEGPGALLVDERCRRAVRSGWPTPTHPTLGSTPCSPPIRRCTGHYRTLVNRAFSARRVAEMEGAVRASADKLISTILPRGVVELGTEGTVPLRSR